jgi:hypothetical protein
VRPQGRWDYVYPAWQFGGDGEPLASIARVIAAGRAAGLDDADLYDLLSRRVGLIGSGTLADMLRDGGEDRVLAMVRTVAAGARS